MTSSLPIISLSPFLSHFQSQSRVPSPELHNPLTNLSTACTTTGFFYLTNHGIPTQRLTQILALTRSFFTNATVAEKQALARGPPDQARGYQCVGENITLGRRDEHEAIDFYADAGLISAQEGGGVLSGVNQWPKTPVELESEMMRYVEEVLAVGRTLVRAMGMALGLDEEGDVENEFVRATERSFWVMRMIGYPELPDGAEGVSCGEHTDYGCVTLLLADETKGALQVRAKDGSWITADPIEGAFVVNIGDMMERWTNGLWKSTLHRVIHKGTNYRVSVPFFFEPNWEAVIEPLQNCIDRTGKQTKYEAVRYGDHLMGKIKGNFY